MLPSGFSYCYHKAFYLLCMSTIFSYLLTRMSHIGLGTLTHIPGPPIARLFLYIAYTATRSFWEIIRVLTSWQVFLWHLIYKYVCYSSFLESVIILFIFFLFCIKNVRAREGGLLQEKCLPDTAVLIHLWTHRDCDCPHKTKTSLSQMRSQQWEREVDTKSCP